MPLPLTANLKISEVIKHYPQTLSVFESHGLGALVSEDGLRILGPFLTLATALKTRGVDVESFVSLLKEAVSQQPSLEAPGLEDLQKQAQLSLLALMPCGLKVPFSRDVSGFMDTLQQELLDPIHYAVEGNMNQELSYYAYVPKIEQASELPDIIVSSDFNTFYGQQFQKQFVNSGDFTGYNPFTANPYFEQAGIPDPKGQYTVLGVNPLVMVVNKDQLGDRPMPKSWEDLLAPHWQGSVTLRGGEAFFCHAVLLPTYLKFGEEGLRKLADNILGGQHPAQMVKLIDKNADGAIYVMPEFFAHRIKNQQRIEIVWPEEGALASPVTLQVKKDRIKPLKPLLDYLTSQELAKTLGGARFPVPHQGIEGDVQDKPLLWLGWDFLRENDLITVNQHIDDIFLQRAIDNMNRAKQL